MPCRYNTLLKNYIKYFLPSFHLLLAANAEYRFVAEGGSDGVQSEAGEDLYFLQGANTAAGEGDNSWGTRPETKLTAAVLTFDEDAVWQQVQQNGPIDVMTDEPWAEKAGIGKQLQLEARGLSWGVYLYRLTAELPSGRQIRSGRFTLVR